MKFQELKNLSAQELVKKKTEVEFELMKSRAQSVRGTVAKNPHQIGGMKRTLSQIETLLSADESARESRSTSVKPGQRTGGTTKA